MKKNILNLTVILFLLCAGTIKAQIGVADLPKIGLSGSNYFMDASKYENASNNLNRVLGFPRTDLRDFTFNTNASALGTTAPTYFDGVIVYNANEGITKKGQGKGKVVPVTPGFYYFSNPKGGDTGTVEEGEWKPLGGSTLNLIIDGKEHTTNTIIGGAPVYYRMGTFKIASRTTEAQLFTDAAVTSVYKITIFNDSSQVIANGVYSFDPATGIAITGSTNVASVYPIGTYRYMVEYLKAVPELPKPVEPAKS